MAIAEATPDPRSQWQRLLDRLGIARVRGTSLALWRGEHGLMVRDPRVLAVAMGGTLFVLLMLQSMLYVPTGWGVEDWLGWVDDRRGGPVAAMVALWRECEYLWLARGYLLIDSLVFVPVYVAFFFMLGSALARAQVHDRGEPTPRARRRWGAVFLLPVLVLAVVDLVENGSGLWRVDGPGQAITVGAAALAVGTTLVSLLGAWVLVPALRTLAAWDWRPGLAAVVAFVAAALAIAGGLTIGEACSAPAGSWAGRLGCGAHVAKGWLILLVVLVPLAGALAWFFAVGLVSAHAPAGAGAEVQHRARLRAAVFDCLVRSRYVLIALALLAGLTVVMDQTRDVIASAAAFLPRWFEGAWPDVLGRIVGSSLVFGMSALALGAFMFSCWLWTRSACHLAAPGHASLPGGAAGPRYEDRFARDWARVLAMVPVLLVVWLSSRVLEDLARAGPGPERMAQGFLACVAPSAGVLLFALLAVGVGAAFLWNRGRHAGDDRYYDCIDWRGWVERAGFVHATAPRLWPGAAPHQAPSEAKYAFFGVLSPARLPVVALVLALVCRAVDVTPWFGPDHVPTLVLPIVLLLLTFWLCVFGWLSLLEIHDAVPWVLLLLALVGGLSLLGWTDNHVVWPAALEQTPSPWQALFMLAFSAGLALPVLLGYRYALQRARERAQRRATGPRLSWAPVLWFAGLGAIVAGVMAAGNTASPRRPSTEHANAQAARLTLDAALAGWLARLCRADAGGTCRPAGALTPQGALEVYFVSAEGGGIRAAMWTATALQQLAQAHPQFVERTFSISAVSGGAVGASVFRACHEHDTPDAREACRARFGEADLLSPLLSGWLFDDLLARVLPTSWCDTPGCGFLTRGAGFEQAMEAAVPALRTGLARTRQTLDGTAHRPYLLLNATWVESGERAIASDLRVTTDHFPAAKDPLWLRARDLPIAAAAHNAARFPYVNAIGVLRANDQRCDRRSDAALPPDVAASEPQAVCGHVADGGYFDNGGAQTTTDVVRALQRCLTIDRRADPAEQTRFATCLDLPPAQRDWLRDHLVPHIVMLRNETEVRAIDDTGCALTEQPSAAQVRPAAPAACVSPYGERYRPDRPVCGRGRVPFLDVVGPLLAVVHTSGIGSNGRLAEARQHEVIAQARAGLGPAARTSCAPTVLSVNLLPHGVRFPLGWHLSRGAVDNMRRQAPTCVLPATDCAVRDQP